MKITSAEFEQEAARYQDAAQQGPITIIRNGHPHAVLVSAAFFEMMMKGRVARLVENLDDATLQAIANSAVPTESVRNDP